MPLRIQSKWALMGMRLAEPFIYHTRTMLPAGKTLTQPEAEKLCLQFPGTYLQVSDPILDRAVEFENDSRDLNVAEMVQGKLTGCLAAVYDRLAADRPVSPAMWNEITDTVQEVVDYLQEHPVSIAYLQRDVDNDNYLIVHSVNVCYLSLVMALAFRSNKALWCHLPRRLSPPGLVPFLNADLVPLALGAMFADVGMVPLQHMFRHTGKLSVRDRLLLAKHPAMGTHMLPADFPSIAKMIVRTHHENFDGTGYPNRVEGDHQHVFTRIVRIADAFTAATARKIYADAGTDPCVLWEMGNGPCEHFYDPVLVKLLGRVIQPFPIGSMLQLTDGCTAVVVKHNRVNPFGPTVMVAFDPKGHHLPANRLEGPFRLDACSDLRIDSFEEEELSFIYERGVCCTSCHCGWMTDHNQRRNLFEAAFP